MNLFYAAMIEDYGISEDGSFKKYPKDYYNDGGESIVVYAATQKNIDTVRRLVESAETLCKWNSPIMNIIN